MNEKLKNHMPYIAGCTCFSSPNEDCQYCKIALALSSPYVEKNFPLHANSMKPGQIKWLLNWHEARQVTLVRKSFYTSSWESLDGNGNQFFGHSSHFYDSPLECWKQALENAKDSVTYATEQVSKFS